MKSVICGVLVVCIIGGASLLVLGDCSELLVDNPKKCTANFQLCEGDDSESCSPLNICEDITIGVPIVSADVRVHRTNTNDSPRNCKGENDPEGNCVDQGAVDCYDKQTCFWDDSVAPAHCSWGEVCEETFKADLYGDDGSCEEEDQGV